MSRPAYSKHIVNLKHIANSKHIAILKHIARLFFVLCLASSAWAVDYRDRNTYRDEASRTTNEALAETATGIIFGEDEQRILGDYLRQKRTHRDPDERAERRDRDDYSRDRDYRENNDRDDRRDRDDDRRYGDYRDDDESKYSRSKQYREEFSSKGKGKGKPKHLPPGLRKKLERGGELPPGWKDKVARGEVLDENLYSHSRRLPEDLIRRLPYVEGTSIREIDNRVMRVQDATRTVLDVFDLMQGQR